jgi:xanthine dehydrogenase YagR molybdenum-binding subunit
MAITWPKKSRIIGTRVPRIDGPAKSTGTAKYSFDINRPGMLHAVMLRCPHAHAAIKNLDTKEAEKVKGFKALFIVKRVEDELYFAGDEVLAICADTEEHALDAVRAVKIEYSVLKAVVKEEDIRKAKEDPGTAPPVGPKKETQNAQKPASFQTEEFPTGVKEAEVTHEGTYGMPAISHQCLESHGLVAEWGDDGGLTVWASTQAVTGTANAISGYFTGKGIDLPASKCKCITQYMGGGFGSKFGPDIQGLVAAELALKAKAPVKLMLDRYSEVTVGGNRPSAYGKVKVYGKKDGTITAFEADTYGSPGVGRGGTVGPIPYVYSFQNKVIHTGYRMNTGGARAMRAPGHPQSCFFTDCALDDFAAKVSMDPLQLRLKNLPKDDENTKKKDPLHWDGMRGTVYKKQIESIAKLCDWKNKWHEPGKGPKKGPWKHGIGMALHTWGGQASPAPNDVYVTISSDGSVLVRTSTQDLGTAQRTLNAIVTAEVLGLNVADITVQIGDSSIGRSHGSGGSTTCPTQAPATLLAAIAARDELFKVVAKKLNVKEEDLEITPGKVRDKAASRDYEWKQACAMLGKEQAKGTGVWNFALAEKAENRGGSKRGVGGVQVAEVWVDTETGIVKADKIYAVQDCGLIINKLGCESQVAGGVIMGLNYGLFEELIADRATGRIVNADMEFYKLGGISDMPKVIVEMMDMPERGVIGIGEPPTISTHAAIGNAVFNALGVRVPQTPFTPDRVLAALSAKGGK